MKILKTYKKLIYEKHYTSKTSPMGKPIDSYVEIYRIFDFKQGLRYAVSIPNFGCCEKRKVDALLRALEHESIGMQKYNCLKEIMDSKNLWNKI